MAGKRNNKDSVDKKPAHKPAADKPAHKPAAEKPAISKTPGRLEGQSLEEWQAHAKHRGNVVHCSGGESWFEAKQGAGE